ncbi:hypothetical protein ACN20G_27335 (plasmid) [Streptomyces sp. BI20]|uniref:hypothetical protein n=1 Tax=Streptomyces sp. BI20 TaxID=3403460 RepID=UPI003C70D48E
MTITSAGPRVLGVPAPEARLRFEVERREPDGGWGRRPLMLGEEPAFGVNGFWGLPEYPHTP